MKSQKNIELLISALSTTKNVKIIKKNQIFTPGTFNEPRCVLFHQGIISLQRQHDNLLLTNLTAPMIIGLRFISDDIDIKTFPLYFRAESDVSYEFIHPLDAKKKINDHQLWESVAMYQMMLTALLTSYLDNMSNVNSSNLIEYCLEKLCHEPEQIRNRRTAVDYIMDKTNLSRSNISKVIATLKKEGRITTYKGLLLSKMRKDE
ncbi:hypothetical protein CJP72_21450 [Citrobacter sp. NCU1]|uniref:helix-turn-helix domain-containing protein n=1 Tax=Citrobacter sp. NCU1 TaxID=2026683 RepID=UPI0013917E51|nr:helix-turn-helix domain-containing protein [Citrobacter sp. NCU1]NDO83238.1 hypothetical protein [Citrobacter sp. NCU1]